MREIKTDYLALAKTHTRHNNTDLLTSIAYSLMDIAESQREIVKLLAQQQTNPESEAEREEDDNE